MGQGALSRQALAECGMREISVSWLLDIAGLVLFNGSFVTFQGEFDRWFSVNPGC
jgi:hypothetical protein